VYSLGSRILGLEVRVQDPRFSIWDVGFIVSVQGSMFGV
jgi:hypothetical protein